MGRIGPSKCDCPLIWVLHLRDHQRHPCRCHPVSLWPVAVVRPPTTHHPLSDYLSAGLLIASPPCTSALPPSSLWQTVMLSSSPLLFNPLVTLLVSNSIWLIYTSLLGKWLWSGLDSCRQLVGGLAATAPTYLFISTLINGQTGAKVNLLLWKNLDLKTNKYLFFCLKDGPNGIVSPIPHRGVLGELSIVEGKWRSCDFGAVGQEG